MILFLLLSSAAVVALVYRVVTDMLPPEEYRQELPALPVELLPGQLRRLTSRHGAGLSPEESQATINMLVDRVRELERLVPPAVPPVVPPAVPLPVPPVVPPVVPLAVPPQGEPQVPSLVPVVDKDQQARHLILLGYSKREVIEQVWGCKKSGNPASGYAKAAQIYDRLRAEIEDQISVTARQMEVLIDEKL